MKNVAGILRLRSYIHVCQNKL